MASSVLITGASSGIGLETAVYLAGKGFRVFATMRDLERRGVLDEAAARAGVSLDVLPLDVLEQSSIQRAIEIVMDRAGSIDAVVCNAGIQLRGYFEDLTNEEIRLVYETNVFGTMAVIREVLPHMRLARKGRIVLISSIGGRMGAVAQSSYCSSKFALEGFGECLALELMPLGIQTSIVEPGIIKTDIWGKNRGMAKGARNPSSPYYAWFSTSERLAEWALRTSPIQTVDVAVAVHSALTLRRPRLRYLVGTRASVLLTLRRVLPGELFDRLYARFMISRVTKTSK